MGPLRTGQSPPNALRKAPPAGPELPAPLGAIGDPRGAPPRRHRLDAPVRCSPPSPAGDRPLVPGPGAARRRSPVVLRLQELELFFDAVQRLRNGEFERLARSLVRGLARWRHERERCTFRHCAAAPWGRGGGAAHRGRTGGEGWTERPARPAPAPGRCALVTHLPVPHLRWAEVNRSGSDPPAPAAAVDTKTGRAGSSPPTPGAEPQPAPFQELCSADAAWPSTDSPPSFPRQIGCPYNRK